MLYAGHAPPIARRTVWLATPKKKRIFTTRRQNSLEKVARKDSGARAPVHGPNVLWTGTVNKCNKICEFITPGTPCRQAIQLVIFDKVNSSVAVSRGLLIPSFSGSSYIRRLVRVHCCWRPSRAQSSSDQARVIPNPNYVSLLVVTPRPVRAVGPDVEVAASVASSKGETIDRPVPSTLPACQPCLTGSLQVCCPAERGPPRPACLPALGPVRTRSEAHSG